MSNISSIYSEQLVGLVNGPHIRLLTLHPAGRVDSLIQCSLTTHQLDTCRPYDALSYVWGDVMDTLPIKCNGETLRITKNLHGALRYLRRKSPRYLWVDATSINQEDLAERACQVMLMGRIYAGASRTIIWLGEPTNISYRALALCHSLDGLPHSFEHLSDEEQSKILSDEDEGSMLLDVLDRQWWTRVWIIQEVCLSKHPILTIGYFKIKWERMEKVLKVVEDKSMSLTVYSNDRFMFSSFQQLQQLSCLETISSSNGYQNYRRLQSMRKKIGVEGAKEGLLETLLRFRDFKSSDPRDKVYALLELTNQHEHSVLPDYLISGVECYTQAAYAIMRSRRDLSVFNINSQDKSSRDPTLPFWVPHWNCEIASQASLERSLLGGAELIFNDIEGCDDQLKKYNPSTHQFVTQLHLINHSTLLISGMITDEVVLLKNCARLPETILDISSMMEKGPWQGTWHALKGIFRQIAQIGSFADALLEWEYFCLNLSSYPTGENLSQVFYASLCRGLRCDSLESVTRNLSGDLRKILGIVKILRWCIFPFRFCLPALFMMCLGLACRGYRLAKTGKKYVAMVPSFTQIGDRIALLPGGKTPYVVRAQRCQWQLVGECYVHGIMFGEEWREEACGPMEFI